MYQGENPWAARSRFLLAAVCLLAACAPSAATRSGTRPGDDGSAGAGGGAGQTAGGRGGRGGTAGSAAVGGMGGGAGAAAGGSGGSGGGGQGGSSALDAGGADTGLPDAAGDARDTGGTGGADGGMADLKSGDTAGDALPGFLAFFQKECATCHGPQGEGSVKGPDLQHPVRDFYTWVVRNGRMHPNFPEPMPRFTT